MLINCPNCGKPVSDKAQKCQHCQTLIRTTALKSEMTSYASLSKDKQAVLLSEFKNEYPNDYKVLDQVRFFKIASIICITLTIIIPIFLIVHIIKNKSALINASSLKDFSTLFTYLAIAIICVVLDRIFKAIIKQKTTSQLFVYQKIDEWMLERNIKDYFSFTTMFLDAAAVKTFRNAYCENDENDEEEDD
ncbi:MAG: zinc ribbon domain-containing protein [Clostridia bacterium]|nr:zinc ribbon domain-containing protein [Clostridia bacterium]